MATKYPGGSRFEPTELGLVKRYLKNKVEKNDSDCIKTLNVYGDAPWLLHHDTNPLYARNEWYYFVPRTVRGVKTVSRMVPGNGESFLGGTWKSVGKRKEIKKNKELKGYKRVLVFNKNVAGKLEKEKTDWHMDEYSLHKNGDEFHDLVLCHVRLLNSAERFKPLVPPAHQLDDNNDNNEGGDINNNQEPCPSDDLAYHGAKDDMTGYGLMPNFNDANQQHEQQQDSPTLLHPPLQINDNQEHHPLEDYAFDGADDNVTFDIDELLNSLDEWKEQEDSPPSLLFPPLQSNDNHGQCPPLVPSQVENHNNTVVPNQEQREALGFANQNDMPMIKKEPDAEDDFIKEILDVHCTQEQLQELEEEQSKALQRVPQAQDSGVRADQVMPKESSQGFLFTNTQT
ncbi:alpha-protein kinase 1 [Raphanus sativus]|nr:alpha-protein kinase 1 [Raphanus sativus]